MKSTCFNAALSFFVVMATGCTGLQTRDASNGMLSLHEVANRNYVSPWENQEEFGYRGWFENASYESIYEPHYVFHLARGGKVIALNPGQEIALQVDPVQECSSIAMLCSANFVYNRQLPFTVEVIDENNMAYSYVVAAYEWFTEGDPLPVETVTLPIFVDGYESKGGVSVAKVPYFGTVKEIRIKNTSASDRQHLMIAAVSLELKREVEEAIK